MAEGLHAVQRAKAGVSAIECPVLELGLEGSQLFSRQQARLDCEIAVGREHEFLTEHAYHPGRSIGGQNSRTKTRKGHCLCSTSAPDFEQTVARTIAPSQVAQVLPAKPAHDRIR